MFVCFDERKFRHRDKHKEKMLHEAENEDITTIKRLQKAKRKQSPKDVQPHSLSDLDPCPGSVR